MSRHGEQRPKGLRVTLAAVTVAAGLAIGGCGDDGQPSPQTAFAQALGTIGSGVSPGGTGFGWVELEAAGAGSRTGEGGWAADALGPGVDDVLEEQAEVRRQTGLDPAAASQLLSVGGSYAFGVRIDGVAPGNLERLYERAGAKRKPLEGWTAYDLGDQFEAALDTRLEVLGGYGSRAALGDDAVILARYELARRALAGGGPSPLSDPSVSFAAGCLGDVVAARTLRGSHTYNAVAAPDLIAVGVRAASDSGREEVICALDDSEEAVSRYASAMQRTLGPGGRDALTGEASTELAANVAVDTLEEGDLYAARAQLELSADREPGLVLEALNRGSVLTFLGAPEPVPGD